MELAGGICCVHVPQRALRHNFAEGAIGFAKIWNVEVISRHFRRGEERLSNVLALRLGEDDEFGASKR